MEIIIRGAKNTIRNPMRTISVIAMLAVAISFALSLLLANQAVENKLEELKTTGATTLTIAPAGQSSGFGLQGGGEPLTNDMYEQVGGLEHVADTGAVSGGGGVRVSRGGNDQAGGPGTQTTFTPPESEIELESPVDAGTLGRRNFGGSSEDTPDFKLPVQATGVIGNLDQSGNNYVLTAGEWFTTEDGDQAVVGKDLAEHNDLSVGSTFKAYDKEFTVIGIYDASDTFRNAMLLIPLKTFQTLNDQSGELGLIVVKVDSIENMEAVETAINEALGDDKVDVSSSAQSAEDAIASLESIQRISIVGVVIAAVAAGVIVFMVMANIVRERKKEVAVLKAIGGSNFKIASQFAAEAVLLTLAGVIVGALLALASGNTLTKALVATNTSDSSEASQTDEQSGPGGFRRIVGGPAAQTEQTSAKDLLSDVSTEVGSEFLLYGLLAVVVVGALGSAIPSYAISKVRPAEILRSE